MCTLGEYLAKNSGGGVSGSGAMVENGGSGSSVQDMRDFFHVNNMVQQGKTRASELRTTQKMMESGILALGDSFKRAKTEIEDSFNCYASLMNEKKNDLLRELDSAYSHKKVVINGHLHQQQETVESLYKVRRVDQSSTWLTKIVKDPVL